MLAQQQNRGVSSLPEAYSQRLAMHQPHGNKLKPSAIDVEASLRNRNSKTVVKKPLNHDLVSQEVLQAINPIDLSQVRNSDANGPGQEPDPPQNRVSLDGIKKLSSSSITGRAVQHKNLRAQADLTTLQKKNNNIKMIDNEDWQRRFKAANQSDLRHRKVSSMLFYVSNQQQLEDLDQQIEGTKSFRLPQHEMIKDMSRMSPISPEALSEIENSA